MSLTNDHRGQKVAIVGGGPIGLFTAILLANRGFKVDVFDKKNWPIDKVCGQGIMPSGVQLLKSMGIEFTPEVEAFPIQGIHYLDGQYQLTGEFPLTGLGIERMTLSEKLFLTAQKNTAITFFPEHSLQDITFTAKNKSSINCELHFTDFHQSYVHVFACDGLHSTIKKILKINNHKTENQKSHRMGARQHIFQRPWSPYVEVYWAQNHSGIEAYVTPVSQNKIEIAFLWYQHQLAAGPQLFLKLIEHFPELREKIDLNLLANDFKAYGPFGSTHHQFNFKNISFLGDAFGFFDGITGEGLSMGMSVSQKVVTDFIPGKKLKWKTQLMIKIEYGKYIALTQIALFFSRHQTLRKMVFKFLRQRPLLFNQLLRWNDQKIFSHSSS